MNASKEFETVKPRQNPHPMNTKNTQERNQRSCHSSLFRLPLVIRAATLAAVAGGLLISSSSTRADQGNQLANPGFETGTTAAGWVRQGNAGVHWASQTYYNAGECPADNPAQNLNVYDGTNIGNLYGTFSGSSYFQQTFATVSGSTWSASAYAWASHEDLMGNPNSFWIDVSFFNSTNGLIAEYESLTVTNLTCGGPNPIFPLDTWVQLLVTNQVQNGVVVGTVPTGVLTAPAGTASVRYRVFFNQPAGTYSGGSMYVDDCVLDLISGPIPPVITGVAPNGFILCPSNLLTYTGITGTSTITNAQVVATTNSLSGTPSTVTYGLTSPSMSVSGLGTTSAVVNLTLVSNTIYNVTVKVTDANGVTTAASATFDTIQPVLVWEAEDFNYNGGVWLTNITADGGTFAYSNVVGTATIDEQDANPGNGPHNYRDVTPPLVSVQGAYEVTSGGVTVTRQKFLDFYAANPGANTNANTVDEEVGYNNNGDWLDYTRNFPVGHYNVYARFATDGSGAQATFQTVTSDPTQANQTTVTNGTFSMTDNNWNVYQYVPLLDQYGNLVSVPLGGTQTVRVQIAPGGNPNQNFYMIVPAVPPQTPVLQSLYPDGVHPFEPTNYLSFTVGKGNGSGIPSGNVHLVLNGADVTPQVSFSGTTNSWTGVIAISSNSIYSAVINVTNSTSLSSTYTISFDTFSQSNFMWEAEDWDFSSGNFIDNPVPTGDSTVSSGIANGTFATNSYYGYPEDNSANLSVAEVDFHFPLVSGETQQYRPYDLPATQVAGDYLRQKFVASAQQIPDPNVGDFNIGYYVQGYWMNYTRTYPAGTYNVYGRMAGGAGPFSGTYLSMVTSGWGTTNQTTNVLGYFADANASGWQTWHWVPMLDTNNNMVIVQLNGSTNTLKLTSGNNLNVNFLMLVPAVAPALPVTLTATRSGTQILISFPTQAGHSYTVSYTSSLHAPITWTQLTVIAGDGTVKTATDALSSSARFYRVTAQ